MNHQRFSWVGLGALATTVGACQLVSGLSGYQESSSTTTGAGGASSSSSGSASSSSAGGASSSSVGGASSSSVGGTGGASSSSVGGTGGAGGSACGLTLCNGACVDTMTAKNNCGECGHVCNDGSNPVIACTSGLCTPVVLSANHGPYESVAAISANDTGVFWKAGVGSNFEIHDSPGIESLDSSDVLAANFSLRGISIAPGGGSVYLTRNGMTAYSLFRWTPGDTEDLIAPVGALSQIGAVQAVGARVVWAGYDGNVVPNPWLVNSTDVPSTANTQTTTVLIPLFAADSVYAYWPASVTLIIQQDSMGVNTPMNHSSTGLPVLFAADSDPSTTGMVYWTSEGGGFTTLYRLPKKSMIPPGDAPDVSLASIKMATGLAVAPDGKKIYWLEDNGGGAPKGRLMSMIWNSPPVVVADNLEHPKNLTLNSKYLYFSADVGMAQVQVFRVVR